MVKQVDLLLTRFKNFPACVTFVQRSVWHQSQFACETHAANSRRSAKLGSFSEAAIHLCRSETGVAVSPLQYGADSAPVRSRRGMYPGLRRIIANFIPVRLFRGELMELVLQPNVRVQRVCSDRKCSIL